MQSLEYLRPFARSQQDIDKIEAMIKHQGSTLNAAKEINVTDRRIRRRMAELKSYAALGGVSPEHDMTHAAPAGYLVKGTSTLYGDDGQVKQQWVKTQVDITQRIEMLQAALEASLESYKGKSIVHKTPKNTAKNLLVAYPFGDPHVGLYAYSKECGDSFDCDIAQALMFGAIDRLCDAAPEAETGLVLSVGDTFHADTSDNKSLNSGHSFDVDTRWSRVLEIGVSTMIRCIDRALQKHKRVIFKAMPGNHDKHSAQMLSICLNLFYSNNKRVTIDTSPSYFWYHRHGKVLIGATHGDTCKPEALPAIMADDVSEDWGATAHRYWYTGHIHTHNVKEFRGVVWESFRTLAARDAWHASKGYGAGRDLYAIVLDSEHGEIERHRCDISRIMRP